MTSWGTVCQGRPAYGAWTATQRGWHINRSDNMAVVSYLNQKGGLRSHPLCRLARIILLWSQNRFLSIRVVHVSGHLNFGTDLFSGQSLEQGEWRLHPQMDSVEPHTRGLRIWSICSGLSVEIPLRQDLLSQARGMTWHPRPDLWKLWAWPLSGVS